MSKRPPRVSPDPIDQYIGSRVRSRRVGLRISQTKLAEAIGITFQQVQKYENGANRIGGSNLYKIARQLDVTPNFFYEDMPENYYQMSLDDPYGLKHTNSDLFNNDPMADRNSISLVHDFQRVPNEPLKKQLRELIRTLSQVLNGEKVTEDG